MSDQPSKRFEMIYELVRRIPRGKVTTYGVIAKKLLAIESLIEMAELQKVLLLEEKTNKEKGWNKRA